MIRVGAGYNVLVVNPAVPVHTVAELVAYLKKDPGKHTFSSGGFGTPPTPPAIQQIQQILGSQRGGATASGTGMGTGAGTSMGPSALGAGLVGVASKKEQPSIRAYKGQSNYSLWEFVFDPRESAQNKSGAGGAGGTAPGAATGAAGNPSGSSSTSVFGGMSGGTPAPAGPSGN